jgi:hypothetical protein
MPKATNATLSGLPISPVRVGTPVTFQAGASGGTGSYVYEFFLTGPSTGGVTTMKRTYSATSTWTWTPTAADVGSSTITVWVKSAGNTTPYDVGKSLIYIVNP